MTAEAERRVDTLPRYFSDMHGAFAVAESGGHGNKVMRQQASTIKPLSTHGRSADGYSVAIGDANWHSYEISVQVMLEPPPSNGTAAAAPAFFFLGSHATSGNGGGGGWVRLLQLRLHMTCAAVLATR